MKRRSWNAISFALLIAGALVATRIASAEMCFVLPDPGQSVVGLGAWSPWPWLNLHTSGGNDVVAVYQEMDPMAYGGGLTNVANGCLIPFIGFADLGSGDFTFSTKKHEYIFTLAEGVSLSKFRVLMLDWGDFMPFGANADKKYAMVMTAFNANGEVVDSDEIAFTSNDTGNIRDSFEFGPLFRDAGDACLATEGEPGRFLFDVRGQGIVRVTLNARDRPSLDPHIAFAIVDANPEPRVVPIDIKPGSATNPVNPKSNGSLPVAILSTADFDASTVLPLTVRLQLIPAITNKKGEAQAELEDVNGDGRPDLVVHFPISALPPGVTDLELECFTSDVLRIVGTDTITLVP